MQPIVSDTALLPLENVSSLPSYNAMAACFSHAAVFLEISDVSSALATRSCRAISISLSISVSSRAQLYLTFCAWTCSSPAPLVPVRFLISWHHLALLWLQPLALLLARAVSPMHRTHYTI